MLRCMSSELHGFGETVETEQLGRPALKAPLQGGFEVFQRTQLQQGWARFAFGIIQALESVAQVRLLLPLHTQLSSLLPGVDTVSLAVLLKQCFLPPLESSSRTEQPGRQLELSELPAALSKASLPEEGFVIRIFLICVSGIEKRLAYSLLKMLSSRSLDL